jgi:acyl-CoA thioesterase I
LANDSLPSHDERLRLTDNHRSHRRQGLRTPRRVRRGLHSLRRGSSGIKFFDRDPHLRNAFSLHARTRAKDPTVRLSATGRKMFMICIIKASTQVSDFRVIRTCGAPDVKSGFWTGNGTISEMNPVGLYFVSGDSFYFGALLLTAAIVASPLLKRPWMFMARNVASWVALAMLVMACPPFSWSIDALLLALFSVWFVTTNRLGPSGMWARVRIIAASGLCLSLLTVTALEFPRRRLPLITGPSSSHLVVIGDSISSGISQHAPSWPSVLQQMTGIPVKNLAKPGARVIDGCAMAENVSPEDGVVLIEIGGNDLLSGTPSSEFERSLEMLLERLAVHGRTVVMFELPLLPNRISYGRTQRRLASKYGVWLVPKRYFVAGLGDANATLDGLHLSQNGARQMALLVERVLSPVLKSP